MTKFMIMFIHFVYSHDYIYVYIYLSIGVTASRINNNTKIIITKYIIITKH